MLDFGFSEILLTSAIALVVLGPERLPKVARQVGNWMGRARVMARQLSEQLEREVNAEALLKEQTKAKPPAHSVAVSAQPPPLSPDPVAVPAAQTHLTTVSAAQAAPPAAVVVSAAPATDDARAPDG